ncbi:MAG: DinB family protein [Pyrinomonadaceae bacterium]
MKYESIADVFAANNAFRDRLKATLAQVSAEEAAVRPEGEKWSIQQIVEHVSMVDTGISMICGRLLETVKESAGRSDGSFAMTEKFGDGTAKIADMKLEAPDRVQPTGNVPIDRSLESMAAARAALDAMQGEFEGYELAGPTFPHPFLGDLNAGEWLVLSGLHQNRHNRQIETLLTKIRQ